MGDFVYVSIIALACYVFLLLAFVAAKKTRVINSFIFVLVSSVLWTGGSVCMRMQFWPTVKFWYDVSILGLLLFTYSLWYFLMEFTEAKKNILRNVWLVLMLGLFVINAATGVFLEMPQIVTLEGGGAKFVYDWTWTVSVLFVACGAIVIHMIMLIVNFAKKDELKKRQLKPFLVGIIMIFAGQLLFLIPFFKGFPIDILSAFIMVLCMFYALYKRRLFKLTLLVSKMSCYAMAGLLAALIFSNFVKPIEVFIKTRFSGLSDNGVLIIALIFTLFTVCFYYVMKVFIDRVFIKDEIARSDLLKDFSSKVSQSLEIDEILDYLVRVINETVCVDKVFVFIESKDKKNYTIARSLSPLDDKSVAFEANNPIINYLRMNDECLLLEDFKCFAAYKSMWEKEKQQLESLETECFVPLKDDDTLVGMVAISGKGKGIRFSYDDISFLSSISSVGSIAVKNSKLYEKAYYEARTDELTGLLNRKYFYEVLQSEYEKNKENSLALIILNIDDFKLYNQLYGNKEGDLALRKVARIIVASVGNNGYVSRYSGKEFAVILPHYDMLAAKNLAETIRKQIISMNKSDTDYVMKVLTVSGGVCSVPYAASTAKELIDNADMAVYQVKQKGKNAIMLSSGGISPDAGSKNTDTGEHKQDVYSEYAATIYALTAAIDTKDHYTFNHSKNVAYYATELGYACGMNDDSIEIIREAALLHDIGKIGISETILNKPGELTDEEYETMKGHVESSVGIIRHLPSLDYVIPAVIGHHERYDGNGYPRRIAGEDIPLSARILCVADSFDAMTSKRSYKKAYNVEFALHEIENQAGLQFDPKLAVLFVQMIRDGKIELSNNEEEREVI